MMLGVNVLKEAMQPSFFVAEPRMFFSRWDVLRADARVADSREQGRVSRGLGV